MKTCLWTLFLALLAVPAWAGPTVVMTTNHGRVTIELNAEKAPLTVANFLDYVDAGFYDGTIFHRVIDGFMVQGGGFDRDRQRKPTRPPIENEADNGLRNRRGTIAMARTAAVDSATAQFFINLKDNGFLDHRGPDSQSFGYAVFGRVTDGMQVIDRIGRVPTTAVNAVFRDIPTEPVVIESLRRRAD